LSVLVGEFGPVSAGSKYDLVVDGVVDMADVDYWLEEMRGTTIGLGADFDLDDDVDYDDLAILADNFLTGDNYGLGDSDFDGDVDLRDFAVFSSKWHQ